MADAQTPVLTDEQIDDWIHTIAVYDIAGPKLLGKERIHKFARAIFAAQAPVQPERAVMQQALETIIALNVQYAIDRYGDASQAESMECVRVARAALSATMEKPNGN